MSFSVSFEGQRRTFKCPESLTPLQTVYPLIASSFGVDINQITLVHRGKAIDPGQPYIMSGLVNNSEVELILRTKVIGYFSL